MMQTEDRRRYNTRGRYVQSGYQCGEERGEDERGRGGGMAVKEVKECDVQKKKVMAMQAESAIYTGDGPRCGEYEGGSISEFPGKAPPHYMCLLPGQGSPRLQLAHGHKNTGSSFPAAGFGCADPTVALDCRPQPV